MNSPTNTWVLVASRTGARIYSAIRGRAPAMLEAIEHPEGRRRDSDLDSDRPGRAFGRMGGGSHALVGQEDSHEHSAISFARDLAARLHKARSDGEFHRLFLVAEPRFLGYLRKALDTPTEAIVADAVAKDWMPLPSPEVDRYVRDLLETA